MPENITAAIMIGTTAMSSKIIWPDSKGGGRSRQLPNSAVSMRRRDASRAKTRDCVIASRRMREVLIILIIWERGVPCRRLRVQGIDVKVDARCVSVLKCDCPP